MTTATNDRREVLAAVYARAVQQANKRATPNGPFVESVTIHELADITAALAAQEGERGGAELAGLRECVDYLAAMDSAGGGVYTPDFRNGFRHALDMLSAAAQPTTEGHVSPMVREAARQALNLRDRIAGDQP